MGYTHYFTQSKHASEEQWAAITQEFTAVALAAHQAGQPLPIQREDDDASPMLVDDSTIIFNGIGDDAHETMVLEREGNGFQFCKTARKPYDRAVIALLLIANKHAPGVWQIGSDGDVEEWQEVVDWLKGLHHTYQVPAGFR